MYRTCGDVSLLAAVGHDHDVAETLEDLLRVLYRPRSALIMPSFAPVAVLNVARTFRSSKRVFSSKT